MWRCPPASWTPFIGRPRAKKKSRGPTEEGRPKQNFLVYPRTSPHRQADAIMSAASSTLERDPELIDAKETQYVSNIAYFSEAVFSYTLKQGIRDGFLAPYKVVKVHIDRDVTGYRPEIGQLDIGGAEVEDRIYNVKDFDRTLVLDDRTKLVARKVTEFLKESGDRFQKTIVFCVDQEHAARMRQALINENADLVAENHRYVMRITMSQSD